MILLFFILLGFFSPAYRGGLISMLSLRFLYSLTSGYRSTGLYVGSCGNWTHWGRRSFSFKWPSRCLFYFIFFFLYSICLWLWIPWCCFCLFSLELPCHWCSQARSWDRRRSYLIVDTDKPTNRNPREILVSPFNIPRCVYAMLVGVLLAGISLFGTGFMELVLGARHQIVDIVVANV